MQSASFKKPWHTTVLVASRQGGAQVTPAIVHDCATAPTPNPCFSINKANKAKTNEEKWDDVFSRLAAFKDCHGHCLVPNRYRSDPPLGSWVSVQRRHHKESKLTRERFQKLENLGFKWEARDPRHVEWDVRYNQLCDYRIKHGNCLVSSKNEDKQLGNWVSTQRSEYKKYKAGVVSALTTEKINRLEAIGFVWEAKRGGARRGTTANVGARPRSNSRKQQALPPSMGLLHVVSSGSESDASAQERPPLETAEETVDLSSKCSRLDADAVTSTTMNNDVCYLPNFTVSESNELLELLVPSSYQSEPFKVSHLRSRQSSRTGRPGLPTQPAAAARITEVKEGKPSMRSPKLRPQNGGKYSYFPAPGSRKLPHIKPATKQVGVRRPDHSSRPDHISSSPDHITSEIVGKTAHSRKPAVVQGNKEEKCESKPLPSEEGSTEQLLEAVAKLSLAPTRPRIVSLESESDFPQKSER